MPDPAALVARLREAWRRSDALFELIDPGALLERPIPLRQPFVFYLGHLPAFAWNQVCRGALGRDSFASRLDDLFERGIDPPDDQDYRPAEAGWPEPRTVLEYRDRVREALAASAGEAVERGRTDVLLRVVEHELMHQETLLYMLLRAPHDRKRRPASTSPPVSPGAPRAASIRVPAGAVTLGAPREPDRFGWDNEFPEHQTRVDAFRVDALPVRNAELLEFVEAGGYRDPQLWTAEAWAWRRQRGHDCPAFWERRDGGWWYRSLFEDLPLARVADWPVYVTWAEARAYARWRGRRLATEAEYHRAAYGTPGGAARAHPWGDAPPAAEHGNFGFRAWSPAPVGTHPAGQSAWGVEDLVGDGWEWTATPFAPFPGFVPMPGYEGYSADFFDGRHYVLLGASWATDEALVRRSFRNWFQPHYPHVFAKFRCVEDAGG
jgi:ergothioneine biosynthesis protein EgtB